jgi:hypothetical protein
MDLDGAKEYGINFNQFKSSKFNNVINANDITSINFSFITNRGLMSNMNISLKNVKFTSNTNIVSNSLAVFRVFPNPLETNNFNINFNSDATTPLQLKVIEVATGRVVKQQIITPNKGINQQQVVLDAKCINGTYVVTLEGDDVKYNPSRIVLRKL